MVDQVWASLDARGLPVNFVDVHLTCQEGDGVHRIEGLIQALGWKRPAAFWDQEGLHPLQSANHFRRREYSQTFVTYCDILHTY
jgi:hypothetical protein